ncbi:hypothetical protein HCN44_007486 [Aphidius gifuensis]|uniref:Ketoreductase domain-containing protein n=1 Tax=Aphidius gifuensis TaxID=684658 RepID=A0A834XQT0_APHGI|nr:hypothetical protein HCN44_007486 [Aphidius gifuensis]
MKKFIINKFPQIKQDHIGNLIDMNLIENIIIEITKGQGVNVVLNFVSDNHKNILINCLKEGGKLLQIKDVDNEINNTIEFDLTKSIDFQVISLIDLLKTNNDDDEILLKLRDLLQNGVNEGIVKPLSSIIFNRDQLKLAFEHLMNNNEVTEKVVIQIQNEINNKLNSKQLISLPVIPRFYCNPNYSYIIYGGLGGFGLELADWLFIRGAKYLILTSRSGIKNGYQQMKINYWKKNGVKVEIISEKLAHIEKDCVNILEISSNIAPVGGIFNLAVELDNKLFCNHTAKTFDYSFKSKAWSTKNFDKLSRKMCKNIKNFVVFSSVASSYGCQGMTSYGMTNSIMEKICEKRIADGLPALSIQWGAIDNVGILENMQINNNNSIFAGTFRQKISSCIDALDKFLMQSQPVVLSMIIPEKQSKKSDTISNIVDAVIKIIGLKDSKMINKHVPLSQLGVDSILKTKLCRHKNNKKKATETV